MQKIQCKRQKAQRKYDIKRKSQIGGLNLQQYLDEVKKRAHEIFLDRGSAHGNDLNDWFQAEMEIKNKFKIS